MALVNGMRGNTGEQAEGSGASCHLGVDDTTREILAADVTQSRVHDGRRMAALLPRIPDTIAQVSGDRGYDTRAAYDAVLACGAAATIVPRRNGE